MGQAVTSAELYEWERIACSPPDSHEKQIIAKLVSECRRLQRELDDPNYSYSGRIHRQALICRDEEIAALREEVRLLRENTP